MSGNVSFDAFSALDLRVGEIKDVSDHPNADKLFVLKVDLGEVEERTIVAGLKEHYSAEDLVGMKAIFIANLEPAVLRGVASNGMILAACSEDKSSVVILTPERDMPSGTKVS